MLISENAVNMLAAKSYKGIGRKWINDNLAGSPSVERIVRLLGEKIEDVSVYDFEARKRNIRQRIEALGGAIDGVVGLGDEDFPRIGDGVKGADRPIALFYKGDIGLIKSPSQNVAVIGLLNPTEQIAADEREVVSALVVQGKCIVSGLALGCDTVGHRETLDRGGKTVAFLSSPLNEVNPPSNRAMAEEIVESGGLLVSEYHEKAHSRNEFLGRYAERDRLQAMFASCVILAASYSQKDRGCDSGSRFAMGKAREYGVPRCVIYDKRRDVGNPMYNLTREEIEAGATIIRPGYDLKLPCSGLCQQETFWG